MAKIPCPEVSELKKLAAGHSTPPEIDSLCQHLESCDQCLHKMHTLHSSDTLLDVLIQAKTLPQGPDENVVSRLIDRFKRLQRPATQMNMLSFQCASCGKGLKAKAELAGKKVKCPQCGKPVPVPGPDVNEGKTLAPASPVASAPGVVTATQGSVPSDEDARLWEFLAPPQAPDEIGRLGPYRVLKVLGAGGMGVVFRAEDPHLERLVALKAMLPSLASTPSAKDRFFREAKAAAALKHPHIVTIHQVGEDRGAPFLAMEFLEGEPLDECLKREKKLPIPEILRIGRQIAEGLQAAHEKGLIHRDIKPANVWLEATSGLARDAKPQAAAHVKILDFGLARAMGDTTHLTQSGAIVGTPAYMAPEQAGGKPVDHRCDLFSLGCVLYRMATGEMPFKGNDTISILSALALDNPPPPAELNIDVPTELSDLIMELLAKDPQQRPESAKVVAEALREMEHDSFSGEPKATRPKSKSQTPKLKQKLKTQNSNLKILILGSAAAVAALVIAGLVIFWQTPHGTIKIESDDPDVVITFDKTGPTIKSKDKEPISLHAGPHGIQVTRGNFTFETDKLVIKKGELTTLKIQLLGGKMALLQDGKEIAAKDTAFTNSLGMEFVLVPKGKSWLGGGGGKPGDKEVEITEDFYLGKFEVTQEEWEKITGVNPSQFKAVAGVSQEDQKRFPVEFVSWNDAQDFIARLNKRVSDAGWIYRLPTDVEWEYACRGGPMTDRLQSAFDFYLAKPTSTLLPEQANFGDPRGVKRTCKVGSYAPNRLGLYDMHGNVGEWSADEQKDDKGNPVRMNRGGCWLYDTGVCRAIIRRGNPPAARGADVGLRLARVPVGKGPSTPFKNALGMEFVLVPKGKSWLGGGGGTPGDKEVEVLNDFYLGKFEVTQEQWEKVTKVNPSGFSRTGLGRGKVESLSDADLKKLPVENLSWEETQLFLELLNKQEKSDGWVYRLPREMEWEYACRGGPLANKFDSAFDFYLAKPANELLPGQANFGHAKSPQRTVAIGSFAPNSLGLHDMYGNVWEWCDDADKTTDGKAGRVARGGAWYEGVGYFRTVMRGVHPSGHRDGQIGLRVARVPIGREIIKIAAEEKRPGWQQLFNGRDLTGWTLNSGWGPGKWTVENGVLRYQADQKSEKGGPGTMLVSERGDYQDFHLRLECNRGRGNGGLRFRVPPNDLLWSGYHVSLAHALPKQAIGSLAMGSKDRILLVDPLVPPDTWYSLDIIMQGHRCTIKVNDKVTAKYDDPDKKWQLGHIVLSPGAQWPPTFSFRKIEVLQLPTVATSSFTNSLGMEFVLVPKGKSWLGGGDGKPGDKEVEITEDFYLGKYEVTQEEWENVMGNNPSDFSLTGNQKDAVKAVPASELKRFPVESINWPGAQEFLRKLNERVKEPGWVYRLPRETEWEYACRSGPQQDRSETAFHYCFGKPSNFLLPDQANYLHDKGLKRPCKVGSYPPNSLGLHDMHGNVWEWCDDEQKDDKGTSLRAYWGGGWRNYADRCRATSRAVSPSSRRGNDIGLRVARVRADK